MRMDSRRHAAKGDSPRSWSPSQNVSQDLHDASGTQCEESRASTSTTRPASRSRSPPARSVHVQHDKSSPKQQSMHTRSPLGQDLPAKRGRVVLRRRQSVLQKASPKPTMHDHVSPRKSPRMSLKSSVRAHLQSPAPPRSRTPKQLPRNCLFASAPVTPVRDSSASAPGASASRGAETQEPSIAVTPQELRARIRAEELRKELLKRSTMMKTVRNEPSSALPSTEHVSLPQHADIASLSSPASGPHASPSARGQLAQGKQRMLEQLTQQMQVCLTRVQDERLDDANREKYQALAASIQAQLEKISNIRRPAQSPVARGGC